MGVLFMMLRQSAINVNVNIHISGHAEIMDCINARKMRSLAENVREMNQLDHVPGIALVTVNGQEYRNLLDFVNGKLVKYMLKYSVDWQDVALNGQLSILTFGKTRVAPTASGHG